jgi:Tol biopolymer transport system component
MPNALRPGDRLAHFQVVDLLGIGGMGEVYRARDQRLERDVALKVLPSDVVQSEERVARFEREARAASSLNHPNIVHIYEIGKARAPDRGQTSADPTTVALATERESPPLHFIAMELVRGSTLAVKIHEEHIALKTLLAWLAQAADGVAKAHAAGIVHRDLNPGNIMVSDDGYAKVMDFGLAKLTEGRTEGELSSAAPRAVGQPTTTGTVVGTAGYMAPEQVRGQTVDARADVFAFGCMLYEATTQKRPFEAPSTVETLHRILHDAPVPMEQLNLAAPLELQRLVRRCLVKEPSHRLDSMRTVAIELREIVGEFEQLSASTESRRAAQLPRGRRGGSAAWITGGLVALAAVAVFAVLPPRPPRLNPNLRTRAIDLRTSDLAGAGLSEDGHWIAVAASDEHGVSGIYLLNAHGGEMRPIVTDSTVDMSAPDLSPDGSQIVYVAAWVNGYISEIRVVPALGGTPRAVARDGVAPLWSPDGSRIGYIVSPLLAHSGKFEFWTVRPDGSDGRRAFVDSTSEIGFSGYAFAWSPDGRSVAWLRNFEHAAYNEIVIHELATGRERLLTHDRKKISALVWTPQDAMIFSSNRGGAFNLWMTRVGGGKEVQLTRGGGPDVAGSVSSDGRTLLYVIKQPLASVGWWNVETGEHGRVTREEEPLALPMAPSPDGQQVALRELDPDRSWTASALVVMNRDGSGRHTVVTGAEEPKAYDWSPDGRLIAWDAVMSGSGDSLDRHIADARTGMSESSTIIPTAGGFGWLYWITSDTIRSPDARGTMWYSVPERRIVHRTSNRDYVYPSHVPGWTVLTRYGGSALKPGVYVRAAAGGPERLVMPKEWECANASECDFLYCWPDSLGFRRLELPSGRLSRVAHGPPEGKAWFRPTRDGRVVFWIKQRIASKLVLLENLR